VTSPTESSNLNIKSYLLNGLSDAFGLVEAFLEMATEQLMTLKQTLARQGNRSQRYFLTRRYLGSLPLKVSYKALELVNMEYRFAKAAFPGKNRKARPLPPCNLKNCTASQQFGIPCRHAIFDILKKMVSDPKGNHRIRLWDLHPHWHLKNRLVSTPYLSVASFLTKIG